MDENEGLANYTGQQYFHYEHTKEFECNRVAWIDLMGVRDSLRKNQTKCVTMRGELLSFVYEHREPDKVSIYSLGDGILLLSDDIKYLYDFCKYLLYYYAKLNIDKHGDWDVYFHRILRVGMALGKTRKLILQNIKKIKTRGHLFHKVLRIGPLGLELSMHLTQRKAPHSAST